MDQRWHHPPGHASKFDPRTPDGTMYAINWYGSTGGYDQYLFEINVNTAVTTEVGKLAGDRTKASVLVVYQ